MADVSKLHLCETIDCGKESKLRCPTCIKNGIPGSFFCSQECFKSNWDVHKLVHRKAKEAMIPPYQPWPGYKFTGKLRPFPVTPKRSVPDSIKKPDYADHPKGYPLSEQAVKGSTEIKVLNDEEIEAMRVVGKLARECLDVAADAVAVGVTADEVDRLVHEAAIERDCYPSPLNYYCFPKSCCTSVNEVICHGIPDLRPLEDGDLLNVDITVYHNGFHGDLNETFFVGNVSDQYKKLVEVTYECLSKAIDIVHPGVKYREIGGVIQKIAQSHGYSVVRSYCGHGIHRLFHTAPNVPHYAKNKAVGIMKAGHTFTIEPMISEGNIASLKLQFKRILDSGNKIFLILEYVETRLRFMVILFPQELFQYKISFKTDIGLVSLDCNFVNYQETFGELFFEMDVGLVSLVCNFVNYHEIFGTMRDEVWPDDWTAVTQGKTYSSPKHPNFTPSNNLNKSDSLRTNPNYLLPLRTQDGKRSAQFEQTLLVTDTGVEILTKRQKNNGQPYFMDKTS